MTWWGGGGGGGRQHTVGLTVDFHRNIASCIIISATPLVDQTGYPMAIWRLALAIFESALQDKTMHVVGSVQFSFPPLYQD